MRSRRKNNRPRRSNKKRRFVVPDPSRVKPQSIIVPTPNRLIGFAAEDARPQTRVKVEVSGFHTFDEGLRFYHMLEAFDDFVKAMGLGPCKVENMLVCVGLKKTYIYANENLPTIMRARAKRSYKAGEAVFRDDIASIDVIDFPNIEPPENTGFMLLLSAGWRRGMCFDLRPLNPDQPVPTAEAFEAIKRMGGMVLAHLWFTERFLLSPNDWDKILAAGWFPFVFLPHKHWQGLFTAIQNGWDQSSDEQKIHVLWLAACDERLAAWRANEHFATHMDFLDTAIRAYKAAEWLTVVSVAAPRVEGLLRRAFGAWGRQREVLEKLAENVGEQEHSRSLLFPDRLRQYFEKVFFRFTPFSDQDLPPTRHTLLHGLVDGSKLTRKEALTLLLLIDHILYCMPLGKDAKPGSPVLANAVESGKDSSDGRKGSEEESGKGS